MTPKSVSPSKSTSWWRSTYRPLMTSDRSLVKAYSTPPPTVQPATSSANAKTTGGADQRTVEGRTGASTHWAEPIAGVELVVAVLVEVERILSSEVGVLDVAFETD